MKQVHIWNNWNKWNKKQIGDLGESLAISFLEKKGHEILAKKYRTLHGEIDIVSHEKNTFHFVEVKTVNIENLSHETSIRPEENVTREKLLKIADTSWLFMDEFGLSDEIGQIDVLCVYLKLDSHKGHSKGHNNTEEILGLFHVKQMKVQYFENVMY